MKKVLGGFVFAVMLIVTGAQAWADGTPFPPPNPKLSAPRKLVLADGTPFPPPNPKLSAPGKLVLADGTPFPPPNPKLTHSVQ
ncbi:MAG TPA: hypothetical protein VKW78_17770 [Terriglobales bacterium]|nr:hypothetical protein [Terriglobales bacterium]